MTHMETQILTTDVMVGAWFAGSGATGEACRLAGRRYLGCKIDPAMAALVRARIAAVLPLGGRTAP